MLSIPIETADGVTLAHLCPCDAWQLEHPIGELDPALPEFVAATIADHLAECVILAASSIAARAATG